MTARRAPRPARVMGRIATLYEVEWLHISATVLACRGNISSAARVLGLRRQSLQRKLARTPPRAAPTCPSCGRTGIHRECVRLLTGEA